MRGWPGCPKCQGTGKADQVGPLGIITVVKCREHKPCGVCLKPMGVEATQGDDPAHAGCAKKDPRPHRVNNSAPHVAHGYTWGKA